MTDLQVMVVLAAVCGISVVCNILITALVFKLYTEYWKDVTIKRRYEEKKGG